MEFILLILIVLVFLGLPVLSMRKQSKQINEIKSFQAQLEPGMIVQMTSGIHARISEVGTTTVDVEVAPGVTTTWDRSAVLKLVETPEAEHPEASEASEASEPSGYAENTGDNRDDGSQVEESTFEDFDTVAPFEDRHDDDSEDRDNGDTPKS
ncbi:preprotein translocase subunit YajC [Corynebacterium sp.]|uniref:preprotein translocase subunit YajC n=1 Tax=Corynebacterium sp. TaxID=1720 RepID=UPI0025C327F3|nr:preprotein translocase subunit YajC [Corynebacterium sp.]